MSAEIPENGPQTLTFDVPADAPEFRPTPTLTAQGAQGNATAGPAEIDSAQMQQAASMQTRFGVPDAQPAQPAQQAPAPPSPEEDVQRLLPDPNLPFALADGTQVVARHLRLREFLSMLKIITRGASMALGSVPLNVNDENFASSLVSLFIFAIPEAEDEAVDFVRKIVDPAPPQGGWGRDDNARIQAESVLDSTLANPDLEDMLSIIETVIRKEGPDLRRLGKRLQDAMTFMQRTGQTNN